MTTASIQSPASNSPQTGKALTARSIFSRETSVKTEISADLAIVWSLLTNAADYARWNSTVVSIEGRMAAGETIRLKSTLDPKRTFKLKVTAFKPEECLEWGDAMGRRRFTLTRNENGSVIFSMREKIGGPLFPLFARMIPPFDQAFEQFAADLKKESEAIVNAR